MSRCREVDRIIRQLRIDNADLTVKPGTRHYKLFKGAKFLGILPYGLRTEGINQDLRSQLRRAGVRVRV